MFAMDETACWMDMPSDSTIDILGARSVPLKMTGHEKKSLYRDTDGTCRWQERGLGLSSNYNKYLVWLFDLVLMAG